MSGLNNPQEECRYAPAVFIRYQERISGSLLDRIDIHIDVSRVDYEKLSGGRMGESSAVIRARVQVAHDRQRVRFSKSDSKHSLLCNADMRVVEVRQSCKFDEAGESLIRSEMEQSSLSARACHRAPKPVNAIADLAGSKQVQTAHLAEVLQYRPKLTME